MIGSPDLLAFAGSGAFADGEDQDQEVQALPEDLSVPLFPASHPWTTAAQFNRDFILVAEFSEQVCTSVKLKVVVFTPPQSPDTFSYL